MVTINRIKCCIGLFILWIVLCIHESVVAQNDKILLIGQDRPTEVKIIQVETDRITFENPADHNILVIPREHVVSIKFQSKTSQKYFIKDLLKALKTYNSSTLVWFGLDFSQVQIIDLGQEYKYSTGLFQSMNNFILDPDKKFYALWYSGAPGNLTFIKKQDCDIVNKRNDKISINECFKKSVFNGIHLDTIRGILNLLENPKYPDGIGMMFFYKTIDKKAEQITGTLVFFDITSRSILLAIGGTFKSDGITMEWHWTKGLHDLLDDFRKEGKFYKDLYKLYSFETKN